VTAGPWTAADRAEARVLAQAFVSGFYEHCTRCPHCAQGGPWCEHARAAFAAIEDWQQARSLLSRAQWLRARQDELEEEIAALRRAREREEQAA
jgi:hypothetical protein